MSTSPGPSISGYAYSTGGLEQIVGSITLAANSFGPITGSDVLGYSFSSVAGDPISFTLTGTSAFCSTGCGLTASSTALTMFDLPPVGSYVANEYIRFGGSGTPNILGLLFMSNPGSTQGTSWPSPGVDIITTTTGEADADGYNLPIGTVIGTAVPSTLAPEVDPSFAVGALTSLLGGVAVLRARHRPQYWA